MKKFAALAALAVVFALAAPVFAATNPFMDVPMNHWAYDAIGQLAAHGILSGYPDGTYKGQQPTTRYELASALARALAVVDMTKASKQDVEMLRKLVVEFKDELDALGVKVAEIDEKVALLDERLGGWRLSGELRLEIENDSANNAPEGDGSVTLARARIKFERWFGDPDNPMHFVGILRGDSGNGAQSNSQNWKEFYVEIPFFFDTTLIAGRFNWDAEAKYYVDGDNIANISHTGGFFGRDSVLTDIDRDALGIQKSFGIGNVKGFVAHVKDPGPIVSTYSRALDAATGSNTYTTEYNDYSAWEIFGMGEFQFTENIGFDLGFDGYIGDNAEPSSVTKGFDTIDNNYSKIRFNDMWTVFAGLRFNFNEDIAFKGIYYYQKYSIDQWLALRNANGNAGGADTIKWREPDGFEDNTKHWAVILDVSQNLLNFTSVWLEYGQYDAGFINPNGAAIGLDYSVVPADLKYYRIVLGQKWNDKWATHEFYYGYDFDTRNDWKPKEWGLGVQYTLNPNTKIGLNYMKVDYDRRGVDDDNKIMLRTQVTF